MGTELNSVGAITLFVADSQRSKTFYERVFDAPVIWEDANSVVFELENTIVNLLDVSQAPGLVGPRPIAASDAGSSFQFTIWVDDADAAVAKLTAAGVELLNGPIDRPWGVRTACFADPDGHVWEVGQRLDGGGPS